MMPLIMFEKRNIMIIVFVIDNYGEFSNGTTVTAKRTKEKLEARGHTVRIVSSGPIEGKEYFQLKKRYIPVVSKVSEKQGMYFSKFDKKIMEKAYENADLIHFFLPFQLSQKGVKLAKKMNIPYTAAFHSQPENVTYGIGLGRFGRPIAFFLYEKYYNQLYRHVERVHCPTTFIAKEMRHNGYTNELHIISNGVSDVFSPLKVEKNKDVFQILSTGRYALEKKQDVLIRAISLSKYKDKIHLVLAGAGPREKKLRKVAEKYGIDTEFGFFEQPALLDKIRHSDLYVHAADAEIEGIACLEAIACGIVPVIAKSPKSATSQFALDERSIFISEKYKELANKIDYWFDNPEERHEASIAYASHAKNYRLDRSIDLFEEMIKQAIEDKRRESLIRSKKGRQIRKRISFPYLKRGLSFIMYYFIAFPFLWIFMVLFMGVRFKNRKVLRKIKGGAVLVSNHVHALDSAMSGIAAFPKKPVFTGIRDNFKLPIAGFFVNILGTVPVPETIDETKVFLHELSKQARHGRLIHFFPEGELIKFDSELRPFKRGAFQIAEEASVPIIPIGISFHEKTSIFPLFAPNKMVLSVGEAIYPDIFKLRKESIQSLNEESFESMNALIHL